MTSALDTAVTTAPATAPAPEARQPAARWRRLWWIVATALVAVAVVFVSQAAVYQPLTFAGTEGTGVTRAGTGEIPFVNDHYGQVGQYYVPPTATSFYVTFSVYNAGPHAVTILGASIHPPEIDGAPPWPLADAGATYSVPYPASTADRPLVGTSVAPHETVLIQLDVRMVDRCYVADGWTGVSKVYLAVRSLTFSHEVAISLPTSFVFHEPEPRGPGVTCPSG